MATFTVHLVSTVSASIEVDADDYSEAMEKVYDSPDMPGGITISAFGDTIVDHSGEWEPESVTDAAGNIVWSEEDD